MNADWIRRLFVNGPAEKPLDHWHWKPGPVVESTSVKVDLVPGRHLTRITVKASRNAGRRAALEAIVRQLREDNPGAVIRIVGRKVVGWK